MEVGYGAAEVAFGDADEGCNGLSVRERSVRWTGSGAIYIRRTSGSTWIFSSLEMCSIRARVEVMSNGLKRNLEQRDANGSMILLEPCQRQGSPTTKIEKSHTG